MEIRDPIHGSIDLTSAETAVIDDPFFQRLRNIKQLGFTEFSFPGATHNRYCHSLGALHLAGRAFDHILQDYPFKSTDSKRRLRQVVRLAALLHDVGHGPLSHTSEEVMPPVSEIDIKAYTDIPTRRATHEDYTVKIVTDSTLSSILREQFPDLEPIHIAQLIDKEIPEKDEFFLEGEMHFRPLLSQIVSSELDVDRMDYLARDSYYCGTSYGHVDSGWLLANLTYAENGDKLNLALNRRALYTFDDFLISRYHMYLMVYFHHKSVIYDEILCRYLRSSDCDFTLPASVKEYVRYDDYKLHTHISESTNPWAKMIANRKPYRMLVESHDQKTDQTENLVRILKAQGIDTVQASSKGRLSKYYLNSSAPNEPIFVVDVDQGSKRRIKKIEEETEVFEKYAETRKIDRIYVSRETHLAASKFL